ncbi:MAG: helix-turn-helix domain-containing protein [Oscillospiraceae bacterium]|jgi:AraC family transcriptional regulator|nr:helix-turn-helix domain-containing protein [Oscillospiraceae bacterium]
MDLSRGIQKAIQYVEDNMLSDLDVKDIAKKAYVSPFYFQRLFLLLSGMTLGTYIRNRRLSLAAVELQSSDSKIIEIAMKYGYDTPESFSRAFERFHSILPSAARMKGAKVNMLFPLSISLSLNGGSVLMYCIEEMKEFRLIGKAVRHGEGYDAPSQLWHQCHADGTTRALTGLSTSPGRELIGLSDGSSFDGETQLYYVATFYDKDTIPEGYAVKDLPARTWIKFMCRELTERHPEADIWKRIYAEFFPASDYIPDEYQMVVSPVGDGSYPEQMGEIWIEVKKNHFAEQEAESCLP